LIPKRRVLSESVLESIKKTAEALNKAHKPILYVGQGILSHPDGPKLLLELSEKGRIPVTTTLMGLGAFDEEHPHSLHMLGMHGSAYANLAMQTADVIIALGNHNPNPRGKI
jgi:acetolactate synthase-1/2/3 large subunit